ncbi:AAA family ATPase [Patescibacteria group bacterium]|nr:AAA family ATPase [Patescibacteria group bacterium]
MFLEKLEIQGFKSFANKNTLVFPGMLDKSRRGITAIVGPNGSGKSNIADSVRWALGEQSMKTLRGKKSEDIIFSGSDKKSRMGMAEVSLFLNNEDRKAPLDYPQVVLTRRLYRSGDSEYLINNSRVRLYDTQMFLAKANFGQKTYSVIGQGMVEGFLNTSLAERKEFFDEATGVKQFQIKRDESLNRLRSSHENLNQAQMLLAEIEPRLKSLTKQVNKLQKGGEIKSELRELQLNYYGKMWNEINDKFNERNKHFLQIEKIKTEKEKKLDGLNRELNKMAAQEKNTQEFNQWQKELSEAQNKKDSITKQLARVEAQLEIKLEAGGQFDLSWLVNKQNELGREIANIKEEINLTNNNINPEKNKIIILQNEKNGIDDKISGLNKELALQSSGAAGDGDKKLNERLKLILADLSKAEEESDLNKIKTALKEIKKNLEKILNSSEDHEKKEKFNAIQAEIINLAEKKEEITAKINESNLKIAAYGERLKLLEEKGNNLRNELNSVETKLKQYKNNLGPREINENSAKLKNELSQIGDKIAELKEKTGAYARKEEEKKSRLFTLQKDMQILQNEINDQSGRLNETKISSTRYETKLENLEIEIRHNFGGLNEIKQCKPEGEINYEAVSEKINQMKRQLDLIGGIDPEIEKEYVETKKRFDFLFGQVEDLTKAINSLKEIIKELDISIKEKFDKEFKLISDKFEEYFKILFSGGRAKIIKVMDDEATEEDKNAEQGGQSSANGSDEKTKLTLDINKIKFLQKHNATGLAGIEIQATPPGKKIKSVSMLSGGERALTAIALICAIISANPSPFVVLDEVDAALDEANSERLAKILEDLSHKTQFIVITHNRASMRRANVLYGITMGDDGVSKLLSIKLEEAKAK